MQKWPTEQAQSLAPDAATLALSKQHLLPPLALSGSCQLVTDAKDQTQHKCA